MAMTLPEADMYYEYAGKHPPISWMVAGYLGVKPPEAKPTVEANMNDLLAMFGGPGKI